MSIARASLVRGPAKFVRGAASLFSKDDIALNIVRNTFDLNTAAHGKIEERDSDLTMEATFTPEGRWDAATIALLWPYASTLPGTSIFGAVDTPGVFHAVDGALHTLISSAVTRMPSIILSANKTMIGPVTIGGVRANDGDWADANSLHTIGTGAIFTDSGFSSAIIPTQEYTGVWGAVPPTGFDGIQTEDGWSIDFNLQLSPVATDAQGVIDMSFVSLDVVARCVPIDPTPAELLTELLVQGAGAARGRALNSTDDLVITGADASTIITLKNCALRTAGFRFGGSVLREGEIAFVTSRPFASGVPGALFTLASA